MWPWRAHLLRMELHRSHYDILRALHPEDGQWVPGHFLAKKLRRSYLPTMAKDMRLLMQEGYLQRDKPNTKTSKHSAWSRTRKADELLRERPRRSKAEFKHQVLDDMDTWSLGFGVDADFRFRLETWKDIVLSGIVPQKTLEKIARGEDPHKIDLPNHTLLFDGAGPLKICTETQHMYTVKEISRGTEQVSETETSTRNRSITLTRKVRAIKEFVKGKDGNGKPYWKAHYNFDRLFIRYITTTDVEKRAILRIIEQEIGECAYIGVAAWKDWGNHDILRGGEKSYPEADGWSFTVPYERVGYPPYLLNRFMEMDR